MRNVASLDVTLGPSRLAGAAVGLAALVTLVVLLLLPVPGVAHALGCAVVLAWAWHAFHTVALRRSPHVVVALHLRGDRLVVVRHGDGRLVAGHVRSASHVAAALTTVVWRADGERFSRAILVLPDMLPADSFRRLRVLLRYARSGVAQGAPASQA